MITDDVSITRRSFELPARGKGAKLAGLAFGDTARPLDVLFIHANGFNAGTYRGVLEPLTDLHILAIDLRGHGRSALWSNPGEPHSWYHHRDDVLALLPQVADHPVVIAGHSMGGATALLTAAARPDLVRALALFDPVVPSPEALALKRAGGLTNPMAESALRRRNHFTSREDAFGRFVGRGIFATWPDSAVRDYLSDGLRPAAQGGLELSCTPEWEAANFAAFGYNPYAAFAQLRVSATILRAETGSTCSITDANTLPATADHRLATIAGSTHFLPLERADLVRTTLYALCA